MLFVSLTVRRITIADAKLIDILTTRTKDQLQKIDDAYVYCYGMTIVSQIKDETSGNYGQFLCAMVTDKPKFDARQIHKAIRGWGTDEDRKIVTF